MILEIMLTAVFVPLITAYVGSTVIGIIVAYLISSYIAKKILA